jgi:DNA-binding CsgD family transcriptional regulator
VWRHTEAEDVAEPGVFPVAADLVEAALAASDRDLAVSVMQRLRARSEAQAHPWGLATLRRCEGLLSLHDARSEPGGEHSLLTAAEAYAALGCWFESGRCLLAAGRAARRGRRWAGARDALLRAEDIFGRLGSDGWAAKARDLQTGMSGRRSASGSLTRSERRIAELASEGYSNKEIAAALFVGEHTVEVHLGHTYRKLGLRSRVELARALARGPNEGSPAKV